MTALLQVRDLVIEYQTGDHPVRPIDGLDLAAAAGELVVLLGPSGCGKTSLLSALGGILTPTSGTIHVGGEDVGRLTGAALTRYRRTQVGFVFQAFNLVPSLTARENVAVPLLLAGLSRRTAHARADALLARVGLAEQAGRRPGRLSGGQQQRVGVARALAADPGILLADEPTANLDYIHAETVIELLRSLRSEGRLIIVSTHDDRLVPIADRVVHLVPEFRGDSRPPHEVALAAGEIVFAQGERGELVYVVDSGSIEITRRRSDGTTELIATVGPGEYFGELGPMLGVPRSATARILTDARLRCMSISDFRSELQAAAGGQVARSTAVASPTRDETPSLT